MGAFAIKNGKLVIRPTAPITDCSGCGACCMYQGRPPLSMEEEGRLPAEVQAELAIYDAEVVSGARPPSGKKARALKSGRVGLTVFAELDLVEPCLWLDAETKQCRNYEHRPAACRVFEVGGKECRSTRREFRIPLPIAQ